MRTRFVLRLTGLRYYLQLFVLSVLLCSFNVDQKYIEKQFVVAHSTHVHSLQLIYNLTTHIAYSVQSYWRTHANRIETQNMITRCRHSVIIQRILYAMNVFETEI